jgi:hypothetical protein
MAGIDPAWLLHEVLRARLPAVIGGLILWSLMGAFAGLTFSALVSIADPWRTALPMGNARDLEPPWPEGAAGWRPATGALRLARRAGAACPPRCLEAGCASARQQPEETSP